MGKKKNFNKWTIPEKKTEAGNKMFKSDNLMVIFSVDFQQNEGTVRCARGHMVIVTVISSLITGALKT